MKISLSVALFESLQEVRQEFVVASSPDAELLPFDIERKKLVEACAEKVHIGFSEEGGNVEIVVNDVLVRAVLVIAKHYVQLIASLTDTLKIFIPRFEGSFTTVAKLAKARYDSKE